MKERYESGLGRLGQSYVVYEASPGEGAEEVADGVARLVTPRLVANETR